MTQNGFLEMVSYICIIHSVRESVRLGEHNLDTEKDCDEFCTDPIQDYDVEKVIPHENFDAHKLKNDIALLRLKKKVPKYTDDSHGSSELKFTQVYGTPLEDCSPLQPEQMQPLSESQLCAGGTLGEDACRGDSGGPLMEVHQHPKRRSAQFFQMGIVSFGAIPCGAHMAPSVYTRVASYLNWILDHIEG
ncbi:Melanization protease 1 [Blattella germanica]|nr:Melanization protease 1 [Blattella germanica]